MPCFTSRNYLADLPAEIEHLAGHLGVELSGAQARGLATEASIERARARAGEVAPEANVDLWLDPAAFFRSGRAGEWTNYMCPVQQERYQARVEELMSPELAAWVHGGRAARGATELAAR